MELTAWKNTTPYRTPNTAFTPPFFGPPPSRSPPLPVNKCGAAARPAFTLHGGATGGNMIIA